MSHLGKLDNHQYSASSSHLSSYNTTGTVPGTGTGTIPGTSTPVFDSSTGYYTGVHSYTPPGLSLPAMVAPHIHSYTPTPPTLAALNQPTQNAHNNFDAVLLLQQIRFLVSEGLPKLKRLVMHSTLSCSSLSNFVANSSSTATGTPEIQQLVIELLILFGYQFPTTTSTPNGFLEPNLPPHMLSPRSLAALVMSTSPPNSSTPIGISPLPLSTLSSASPSPSPPSPTSLSSLSSTPSTTTAYTSSSTPTSGGSSVPPPGFLVRDREVEVLKEHLMNLLPQLLFLQTPQNQDPKLVQLIDQLHKAVQAWSTGRPGPAVSVPLPMDTRQHQQLR